MTGAEPATEYETAILALVRKEMGATGPDERLDRAVLLAVGHVVADMY